MLEALKEQTENLAFIMTCFILFLYFLASFFTPKQHESLKALIFIKIVLKKWLHFKLLLKVSLPLLLSLSLSSLFLLSLLLSILLLLLLLLPWALFSLVWSFCEDILSLPLFSLPLEDSKCSKFFITFCFLLAFSDNPTSVILLQ